MKAKISITICLVASFAAAQDRLSLDEAIALALQKNYAVQVSKHEREITNLQNNIGNAGLSPTVSINAGASTSNLNSYQLFTSGLDQDRRGAVNFGRSASINAEWTIFDGFRMFAVRKRLQLTEDVSELELKRQMEATVFDVIASYYEVVRGRELIKAAEQNLRLYEERRKIAELRLEIGSDSKVDLLLSRSDENRARAAIVQFELDFLNAKTTLNVLLGRGVEADFSVADTILLNYSPTIEDLQKSVPAANTDILISRQYELIADQSVREARSFYLPSVTINGGYLYNRTQSEAGFVLLNRQSGFNGAINARWNIFNGGRNSKLAKERSIQALNQRLFTSQTQLEISGQVFVNYQRYLLNRKIAEMELSNLQDAREVQLISLERYRIGKSGVLETIETQKNLEDVQVRYINALYESKIAEAALMRANGELVK